MKTKTRTLIGILGASIVGTLALENIGRTNEACEVYQGVREDGSEGGEGTSTFIFDPYSLESRGGAPKFGLQGNPNLKKNLQIGEKYCFDYIDPIAPWELKKLKRIFDGGYLAKRSTQNP
jgi:hypothetical protein